MDQNPNKTIENLAIGKIIEVDGSHIIAELNPDIQELSRVYGGEVYPIGQFGSIVKVHFGRKIIYGYVGRLRMKAEYEKELGIEIANNSRDARVIEADLFGEGEWILNTDNSKWELNFERGVATFPLPQQTLYLTPSNELRFIYGYNKGAVLKIGEHVGSAGAPCFADLNELFGKHTAILGSTGSGKSGAVATIIHALLNYGIEKKYKKWNPQIVILDPHNEYSEAFPDKCLKLSTDEGKLSLPYWLLSLQETSTLLIGKTEFAATSQTNIIKRALLAARKEGAKTVKVDYEKITVDSPVPYDWELFKKAIEDEKADLTPSKQDSHNSILGKIEVIENDARMKFLIQIWDKTKDNFPDIVEQFLGGKNLVKIIDLSGIPNEVAGLASSVIARLLFNFKVWQTMDERESSPILFVCEEAHRYVPNRGEAQYAAAQEAIRRIAKEGRKYGLGLILVSQRPSEVEETVLSQCNSWIVLRIANEEDQQHVRSVLPDSLAGLTKILPGLRRREAIFVGQAAMLPSRIMLNYLDKKHLPRSNDIDFDKGWQNESINSKQILEIGNRWRLQEKI